MRDTSPGDEFRLTRVAAPLRQGVVEVIRNAIASGRFAPGERLTEKALCELFGVSRTLLREALRQLESEGLIDVVPNKGSVVASVSPEQAEQIYKVRSELEALACELFALNASDEDLAALNAAIAQLQTTVDSSDPSRRLSAKSAFYDRLVQGGRNEPLGQVLNLLNARITLLRATSMQHEGRWRQSVLELEAIAQALSARDVKRARKAAILHVNNASVAALGVLRRQIG